MQRQPLCRSSITIVLLVKLHAANFTKSLHFISRSKHIVTIFIPWALYYHPIMMTSSTFFNDVISLLLQCSHIGLISTNLYISKLQVTNVSVHYHEDAMPKILTNTLQ